MDAQHKLHAEEKLTTLESYNGRPKLALSSRSVIGSSYSSQLFAELFHLDQTILLI